MNEISLDVQIREEVGTQKIKPMRSEGLIPAVVYGGNKPPTAIKVDRGLYEGVKRAHSGQNVVFHLNVQEGEKKVRDYSAILKEEQLDPVSDQLIHIDFHRISLTDEIEVKVKTVAVGEAIGVKRDGGSLDHAMWELDVACLPTNIPTKIEVDVSALEIGGAVHVKEIKLPEGVKTKYDPEAIVFSVVPPMKEESEVTEEVAEPEVIGEKEKQEKKAESEAEEKAEKKSEEKSE